MLIMLILLLISSINLKCNSNEIPESYYEDWAKVRNEYYLENNPSRALEILDDMLVHYPNKYILYAFKSDILKDLGRNEEAISVLTKALENPLIYDRMYLLSRIMILYDTVGKPNISQEYWAELKKLNFDTYSDTLALISFLIYKEEYKNALSEIDLLLKSNNDRKIEEALYMHSTLLFKQGNYQGALVFLDELIDNYKKELICPSISIIIRKSIVHYMLNDFKNAILYYKIAINALTQVRDSFEPLNVDEYFQPSDKKLAEFNILDYKYLTDISEPSNRISYDNLMILEEIHSYAADNDN